MMRAFIFDMDGTLADSMPFHEQAWNALMPELGVKVDRDEFFRWSAGLTNREIFPRLLGRALADDELQTLSGRKEALYRQLYTPHCAPLRGAVDFLRATERAGILRAVGTAAPPENVTLVLDGLDLRRYFQAVVGGADIRHGKPDPEVFLIAADRLRVRPADCVVFEDAPAGVEAARRAGMQCVVVTTTLTAEKARRLPATEPVRHIVADFTDPALDGLLV